MKPPAVHIDICLAFLQRYLEGFRGYPPTVGGQRRFAEALQLNVISVEHLEATLQTFDDDFPTVRQIHDVALNLRPRFEPQEDLTEKWREEYGSAEQFKYPADEMAMHWQAFRDMLYYTEGPGQAELNKITGERERRREIEYWERAKAYDFDPRNEHADSIAFVRHQIKALGWTAVMALDAAPEPMPYTNPLHKKQRVGSFATPGAIITQADIDRAVQHRKSTQQVDAALDSWTDPDR
jgi:hypothetical protein